MGWKMTLQHHFIYRHSLHTDSFEETTFSHAATRRGKGNKRFLESPWTQFHGITGIGIKLTLFSERSLCSNKESRSRTLKERERVGKSLALGAAAGRRGGIAAFCGKQVPPNQTSSGKVYLVWIWSQLQSMEELV